MKSRIFSSKYIKTISKGQIWIPAFIALGFLLAFPVTGMVKLSSWSDLQYSASQSQILYNNLWKDGFVLSGLIIASIAAFINSVNGFIYYMDSDSSTNKPGLIINNIALTRYHEPVDTMTVAGKDSLAVERRVGTDSMVTEKKADSIQSVDIRKNVPARMNPREMKENNAADHSHSDRPQRIKRRN